VAALKLPRGGRGPQIDGNLHGLGAVAALKHRHPTGACRRTVYLHGLGAVAALKLLRGIDSIQALRYLHGLGAVAALKPAPQVAIFPDAAGKSPRSWSRGRIEATMAAVKEPEDWASPRSWSRGRIEASGPTASNLHRRPHLHGLGAVAALKLEPPKISGSFVVYISTVLEPWPH